MATVNGVDSGLRKRNVTVETATAMVSEEGKASDQRLDQHEWCAASSFIDAPSFLTARFPLASSSVAHGVSLR